MNKNSPEQLLEDNNIRSSDLYSGEIVQRYLEGEITRRSLVSLLKDRRDEFRRTIKGIDNLLTFAEECQMRCPGDY